MCWHSNPFVRPPFSKVVRDVKLLRRGSGVGSGGEETPSPLIPALPELEGYAGRPSPDMHPIALPGGTPRECVFLLFLGGWG